MEIISKKHGDLVEKIKELLIDFLSLSIDSQNQSKDQQLIKDLLIQLDDLFLIVIAGEYNSGKSAFINALLGGDYLKTGVTPTTSDVTILRYAGQKKSIKVNAGQSLVEIPAPLLNGVSLVDTPGTNAIQREHEALTSDFIPRSDLVVFITSVDRPFTESERIFLESIRGWGKKVVILINKIDIIESDAEMDEVKTFVSKNAAKLLGVEPRIFFVSAKDSLKRKLENKILDPFMSEIETFIGKTLNPKEQIPLKLSNPLGVLEKLINQYKESATGKMDLIHNDIQLLSDLESQIRLFREDMIRSFKFRYSEIDNKLLEFEKRGLEFFDNTFRFGRILDLLNKEKIQSEYNRYVLRDLSREIDTKVEGLIDWLVEEDLKQWHVITQKIDRRIQKYQDRILETPESRQIRFERQKIIDSVRRESLRVIEMFDKEEESSKIAEDAQMAVAASVAIEVGAFGLGALVTLLATTASADLTGILLAGLTATLGFFIIPAKRKQARALFSRKISDLRKNLSEVLLAEFSSQVDNIVDHINQTILPYSRFIRSEQTKLEVLFSDLDEFSRKVILIKDQINSL